MHENWISSKANKHYHKKELVDLAKRISKLNVRAGEIGDGMLQQLVMQACHALEERINE